MAGSKSTQIRFVRHKHLLYIPSLGYLDIWVFVIYYIYGISWPSLLIESTDSMITIPTCKVQLTKFSFIYVFLRDPLVSFDTSGSIRQFINSSNDLIVRTIFIVAVSSE